MTEPKKNVDQLEGSQRISVVIDIPREIYDTDFDIKSLADNVLLYSRTIKRLLTQYNQKQNPTEELDSPPKEVEAAKHSPAEIAPANPFPQTLIMSKNKRILK